MTALTPTSARSCSTSCFRGVVAGRGWSSRPRRSLNGRSPRTLRRRKHAPRCGLYSERCRRGSARFLSCGSTKTSTTARSGFCCPARPARCGRTYPRRWLDCVRQSKPRPKPQRQISLLEDAMSNVETLLRECLTEQAAAARPPTDLLSGVYARSRRMARRQYTAVGIAAAVAAIAVAVGSFTLGNQTSSGSVAQLGGVRPSASATPVGNGLRVFGCSSGQLPNVSIDHSASATTGLRLPSDRAKWIPILVNTGAGGGTHADETIGGTGRFLLSGARPPAGSEWIEETFSAGPSQPARAAVSLVVEPDSAGTWTASRGGFLGCVAP